MPPVPAIRPNPNYDSSDQDYIGRVSIVGSEEDQDPLGTEDNPMKVAFTLGDQPDIDLGNVDVESVIPGTGATNLGKAEDAVHTSGDVGVMGLSVRKDTPASVAADGDYHPTFVDSLGRVWAHVGAIEAGENVIGKVASSAIVLNPTLTVDATPDYSIGDALTDKVQLTGAVRVSGGSSLLHEIHILDRSNQKPTGNILIFNADPTAATITKNAAFVYSTDDLKQVARIPVTTGDYVTINTKATADLAQLGRMVKAASGTSLWYVFVLDAVLNLAATDDISIFFKFIPVD